MAECYRVRIDRESTTGIDVDIEIIVQEHATDDPDRVEVALSEAVRKILNSIRSANFDSLPTKVK